jgi:hypothetical protein
MTTHVGTLFKQQSPYNHSPPPTPPPPHPAQGLVQDSKSTSIIDLNNGYPRNYFVQIYMIELSYQKKNGRKEYLKYTFTPQ